MLQQTQVDQAVPYFNRFIERFPTVRHLAKADQQDVLKAWEGLGYYARARNLHRAAITVMRERAGEVPRDVPGLRTLPGVGEYIARAVASIAFDAPVSVVDSNVKRCLARIFLLDDAVNTGGPHRSFARHADALLDSERPGLYNQAMMELGALVCAPRGPHCGNCPVSSACLARRRKLVDEYPKRVTRRPPPTERIAVGVVQKGRRLLITRRKPEGLLGGLWEFPGGKLHRGESAASACARELAEEVGLAVVVHERIARVRHAYTHFKIVMDVFRCTPLKGRVRLNGPVAYKWVTLSELQAYPFPKANSKFIPLLESALKA
jgi:A/G-specific adenine glycosylase